MLLVPTVSLVVKTWKIKRKKETSQIFKKKNVKEQKK